MVGVDSPSRVYAIQKLMSIPEGILEFSVDVASGDALLMYDANRVKLGDVIRTVRNAGYDVLKNSIYLVAALSEEEVFVTRLDGVIECRAFQVTGLMAILYNPLTKSKEALVAAIRRRYPAIRETSEEVERLRDNGDGRGR